MEQNNLKRYPNTTPELAKMLKLSGENGSVNGNNHSDNLNVPKNLPEAIDLSAKEQVVNVNTNESPNLNSKKLKHERTELTEEDITKDIQAVKRFSLPPFLGILLPYAIVFLIGLFLYFFFFSRFDFGKLFSKSIKNTVQKVQTQKENALLELQKRNMNAYKAWISKFYFEVSDQQILDPDVDNSGNGLSNFQKFILKLNPKTYDTLSLGRADSESIAMGINPLTGGKLTESQKGLVEEYFDMEVIMNRLALANLHKSQGISLNSSGKIAGAGIRGGSASAVNSFSNSNISNTQTFIPVNTGTNANMLDSEERVGINLADVDTNIPGRLEIPSLGVNAPIIWTKNPKNFDKDLQAGVVHYPGTALPGQIGTTYISGHSSNYVWAKGNYNNVFAKLGELPNNTSFKITVVQKNGKDARFHYVVTHREEYKPTDQEQFKNTGKQTVALSTCWPIGSTAKRLVVFAELTQSEID